MISKTADNEDAMVVPDRQKSDVDQVKILTLRAMEEPAEDSVPFDNMTWKVLVQISKKYQKEIETVRIVLINNQPHKDFNPGPEEEKFNMTCSIIPAAYIDHIKIIARTEPPEATERQSLIALTVSQIANMTSSEHAVKEMMKQAGLTMLHMGDEEKCSEYVIAECKIYNEVTDCKGHKEATDCKGCKKSQECEGKDEENVERKCQYEIYIAYRGATDFQDLIAGLSTPSEGEFGHGETLVSGFDKKVQLLDRSLLFWLLTQTKTNIILCGHSTGGAAAAVRLITILSELNHLDESNDLGLLLSGRIRVIGFGVPLFATKACSDLVSQTLNCWNLFRFFVLDSDPVPFLLSNLSGRVRDAKKLGNCSRDVVKDMFSSSPDGFKILIDVIMSKHKDYESIYFPVGQFIMLDRIRNSNNASTWTDASKIQIRLESFETDVKAFLDHASLPEVSYASSLKLIYADQWKALKDRVECPKIHIHDHIPSSSEPRNTSITLDPDDLWIKVTGCPLHLCGIRISGFSKEFTIGDRERIDTKYRTKCRRSSCKSLLPTRLASAKLKIGVTDLTESEKQELQEILLRRSDVELITTLGENLRADIKDRPTIVNGNSQCEAASTMSQIYQGALLCALMETVHERDEKRVKDLNSTTRMKRLLSIADKLEVGSVKSFVCRAHLSHDAATEDAIHTSLKEAEKCAREAGDAVVRLIFEKMEVKLQKGHKVALAGAFVLCTILSVGGLMVCLPAAAFGLAAEFALGASFFVVGFAGARFAASELSKEDEKTKYEEKLKLLLGLLDFTIPTRQVCSELETALEEGMDGIVQQDSIPLSRIKEKLFIDESAKKEIVKTAEIFLGLIKVKKDVAKQKVIVLLGCKNAGKSTGAKEIFGLEALAGAAQSTLFPILYQHRMMSAMVVDFPGSTEVLDRYQLATNFLILGGAGAWCLIFVDAFKVDTRVCELIVQARKHFDSSRILIICTHGDCRDAEGCFQVDTLGGVQKVKEVVVNTLENYKLIVETMENDEDQKEVNVNVLEDNILVSSFAKQGDLPSEVLNSAQLKELILSQISS